MSPKTKRAKGGKHRISRSKKPYTIARTREQQLMFWNDDCWKELKK
jgi:hypothetical protein